MSRRSGVLAGSAALLVALAGAAEAQEGAGGKINPGRDCKTITTCEFSRAGAYRGCVSSYSCRVCRFVRARCHIIGKPGGCHELRCGWGA